MPKINLFALGDHEARDLLTDPTQHPFLTRKQLIQHDLWLFMRLFEQEHELNHLRKVVAEHPEALSKAHATGARAVRSLVFETIRGAGDIAVKHEEFARFLSQVISNMAMPKLTFMSASATPKR